MPRNAPHIPELKPDKYTFTEHAVGRFVERNSKLGNVVPKNPEKALRRLMRHAEVEAVSPTHKAMRLMNNNYRDVTYLVSSGWRFVVSDDNITVVTVERVDPAQN